MSYTVVFKYWIVNFSQNFAYMYTINFSVMKVYQQL